MTRAPGADASTAEFERHRGHLLGLAYRMLGSRAEAEDAVQEAWLRWSGVDTGSVGLPRAFLSQTVTRLCLDRLKSAQLQREVYVGPWLPEPVLGDDTLQQAGPESTTEFANDLSVAFMLALERLSPLERAAFLLHDVFDAGFPEVAAALGRSEAACRQLASRARVRVREARPRFEVGDAECERLAGAFLAAAATGDLQALSHLLAEDARLVADGGGVVFAARVPVVGRRRVVKLMDGLRRKYPLPLDAQVLPARINGLPGCIIGAADGTPIQTVAIEATADGHVAAVYVVRNPEKLRHLAGYFRRH